MSITKFAFPTTIHFGAGARHLVAAQLREQGCQRPLIVTDRGVAQLPLLDEFRIGLKGLDNRTASFRVIAGSPKATRLETRCPGADVNPYLRWPQ